MSYRFLAGYLSYTVVRNPRIEANNLTSSPIFMETASLPLPTISVTMIYEDAPDLLEIETRVHSYSWQGVARAYAATESLRQQAVALDTWCKHLTGEAVIEAGADTGVGWILIRFYRADSAGQVLCHVTLATGGVVANHRPEQVWRLSLEIPTEVDLVEQFARSLQSALCSVGSTALLQGISH